jgi:predicted Zn-dependent peptidase
MLNYRLTKLDNGLQVITAPLENTRAVTILILFGVGSRFESLEQSGLSHFLEHMFFKGTKARPTTLDISRELDNVGASYNAFTGEELTGYFVRVPSEHFGLGLEILADILFDSKFEASEIEKEKGVIVEEINMINDDPRSRVELIVKELVYGDHPLGRKITGEKESVKSFKQSDFIGYKEKYYQANNAVVAVAGGSDSVDWLEKIQEKFGGLKSLPKLDPAKVIEKQNQPLVKISFKETDQAHFILGFRSIPRLSEKRPVLKIITGLMGQMMSSRLFIEVREKLGLCYYVYADMADFQDTGFWAISAGVDINRINEAIAVILKEVKKIINEPVTDEELTRAKENLKGHLFLGLEESMSVANFLAEQQLFWGKIEDPDEVAKKIDAVTKEQIQALSKEKFTKENLNLAIVGPFKDSKDFQKIIDQF